MAKAAHAAKHSDRRQQAKQAAKQQQQQQSERASEACEAQRAAWELSSGSTTSRATGVSSEEPTVEGTRGESIGVAIFSVARPHTSPNLVQARISGVFGMPKWQQQQSSNPQSDAKVLRLITCEKQRNPLNSRSQSCGQPIVDRSSAKARAEAQGRSEIRAVSLTAQRRGNACATPAEADLLLDLAKLVLSSQAANVKQSWQEP